MIFNPNVMAAAGGGGGAVVGTYTGNGKVGREIALPFAPALLIVKQTSNYSQYITFITAKHCITFRAAKSSSPTEIYGCVAWLTKSIDDGVLATTSETDGWLNLSSNSYTYIAIPKA